MFFRRLTRDYVDYIEYGSHFQVDGSVNKEILSNYVDDVDQTEYMHITSRSIFNPPPVSRFWVCDPENVQLKKLKEIETYNFSQTVYIYEGKQVQISPYS